MCLVDVRMGWILSKMRWLRLSCLLLWWLILFIEALVLSPNNEREGRQQLAISKGNI